MGFITGVRAADRCLGDGTGLVVPSAILLGTDDRDAAVAFCAEILPAICRTGPQPRAVWHTSRQSIGDARAAIALAIGGLPTADIAAVATSTSFRAPHSVADVVAHPPCRPAALVVVDMTFRDPSEADAAHGLARVALDARAAVLIIADLRKDGEIRGPASLMHSVDVVAYFRRERTAPGSWSWPTFMLSVPKKHRFQAAGVLCEWRAPLAGAEDVR